MADPAPAALGVYKSRRLQASPLFRVVSDHLHRLQTVYDDRFAREYGPWRPVVGERDLAVGIVACLQTHGSRAPWHPHLHLLVTDGGFRPDGTFVSWPVHDTARLTAAFREELDRAVATGFTQAEVDAAEAGYVQGRSQSGKRQRVGWSSGKQEIYRADDGVRRQARYRSGSAERGAGERGGTQVSRPEQDDRGSRGRLEQARNSVIRGALRLSTRSGELLALTTNPVPRAGSSGRFLGGLT